MRIHLVAMMVVLTAAVVTGCDSPREVRDTGRAEARGCNHCHGYPPPPTLTEGAVHPVGVTASSCFLCHPSTVLDARGYVLVDGGTHQNGTPEVDENWQTPTCIGCHDTPPDTGHHLFHWRRMVAADRATCATCHRGFEVGDDTLATRAVDAEVHMNGRADVILDLAEDVTIETANQADGSWSESSCFPCHDALGVND